MQLIDTHSHLYDEAFESDLQDALARASDAGVKRLLLPAIDSESHEALFTLCRMAPNMCRPMMGLHPTSVNENPHWREELAQVEQYLLSPPEGVEFCAVGEIGLDYYWSQEYVAEQREAFGEQCRLAARLDLPVAIDVLRERSGMSLGELSLMLMNMELSGAVRQLPGKLYEKLI